MFAVADLNEKYVLCVGKSFGLRAGDFLRLARGDLEPYIDKSEPPISIGSYRTQKEGITAYPFIDNDALPIIKLKLDKMTREGFRNATDRMLKFSYEVQLSRVIKRLVIRAGINTGNKQVRFHCMRKFLIDHLSSFMNESKWKLIVGKSISESAYVSPDSLREDYKRAMAEITFNRAIELEDRLKKIEEVTEKLPEDVKATMQKYGIQLREKAKEQTDCDDGEHCGEEFKQISEADLLQHLKDGWNIIKELSNSEVIVKR